MVDAMQYQTTLRTARCRQGSALLVCTLAVAVVGLSSIAILRSSQRHHASVDGIRASRQARYDADGMLQRAVAALRVDPNTSGSLPLGGTVAPSARCELVRLSADAVRINCLMYDNASIPARELVVDPNALGGGAAGGPGAGGPDAGGPGAGGPGKGKPDKGKPDKGKPDKGKPDKGKPDKGKPDKSK